MYGEVRMGEEQGVEQFEEGEEAMGAGSRQKEVIAMSKNENALIGDQWVDQSGYQSAEEAGQGRSEETPMLAAIGGQHEVGGTQDRQEDLELTRGDLTVRGEQGQEFMARLVEAAEHCATHTGIARLMEYLGVRASGGILFEQ